MLPVFLQQLHGIVHKTLTGQGTNRGFSPNIWSRLTAGHMAADGSLLGYGVFDDFNTLGKTTAVAANVGRYASEAGAYLSYEDTGDAISQLATEVGGVLNITTAATDNNETWIQPGMATSVITKVSLTSPKLVLFEARWRPTVVTDTYNAFVGLSEEGLAAADTIADAGTLASKDMIGFWVLEGDGDALKYGYQKASGTLQTLGSVAITANTFVKVGFAYDPSPQIAPANRLSFYVNNDVQSVYGTDTLLSSSTNFPAEEELNFLLGMKNQTSAAKTTGCDWYGVFSGG